MSEKYKYDQEVKKQKRNAQEHSYKHKNEDPFITYSSVVGGGGGGGGEFFDMIKIKTQHSIFFC
jgi:hypothetical protein